MSDPNANKPAVPRESHSPEPIEPSATERWDVSPSPGQPPQQPQQWQPPQQPQQWQQPPPGVSYYPSAQQHPQQGPYHGYYQQAPPQQQPVVPVQQVVTVQGQKGRGCLGTAFQGIGALVVVIFVLLFLILIF